jgi:uncharacterized protein
VTGLVGGFASGLLGLGGAFLFIPPMISLLHMTRHSAHASTLGIMLFSSSIATLFIFKDSHIMLWEFAFPVVGAIVGVIVGSNLMVKVDGRLLGLMFGLFLVAASVDAVIVDFFLHHYARSHQAAPSLYYAVVLIMVGLVAGFASGLFGVGSGGIVVPLVVSLLGTSQIAAQGISLAVIIPISLVGSGVHWIKGTLHKRVVLWMAGGAIAGSIIGVRLAIDIPGLLLKVLFVTALLGIGLFQIIGSAKRPSANIRAD